MACLISQNGGRRAVALVSVGMRSSFPYWGVVMGFRVASFNGRVTAAGVAFAAAVLLALGAADSASAAGSVQPAVGLGTADAYEVLAATTVTNTGPTTVTNGDVGLSPGTAVTGFPPAVIANGVIHKTDAQAQQAQADLTTAYNDAAGRSPDVSNIIDLANQTLVPGVYSGDALALNGTVTLNGPGVYIFQAASTLITASSSTVALTGGATSCDVFWQVGSSATLGSGSVFTGTIMALTSITADSTATIDGRLLARNGAVTLDSNVITRPASCGARAPIVASTPTAAQTAAAAAAAAAAKAAAAAQAAAAQAAAAKAAAAAAGTAGSALALADTGSQLATTPWVLASGLIGVGALLIAATRRRPAHRAGRRNR